MHPVIKIINTDRRAWLGARPPVLFGHNTDWSLDVSFRNGKPSPRAVGVLAGCLAVVLMLTWSWLADNWAAIRGWLLVGAVVVLALVVARLVWRSSAATMAARERRANRTGGWATPLDIMRSCGWWWLRRQAVRVRPSLASRSWWYRWFRLSFNQIGVRVCKVRVWCLVLWIYASHERITIRIAGPQVGKTSEMNNHLIDAPGAVLSTSIRTDTIEATAALRARLGPVMSFDPDGLGADAWAQLVKWNPLIGCESAQVANRRAVHFMSGIRGAQGVGNREFWTQQSVRVLDIYLHAAALAGNRSIFDVLAWVGDANHAEKEIIEGYLAKSEAAEAYLYEYRQFCGSAQETSTSTTTTLIMALQWLRNPMAARLVAMPGEAGFNVDSFLRRRGTVYLVAEEDSSAGPLFTAFTGYIYESARARAGRMTRSRLDPPLTLVLDEAANICAVPLHRWTSTGSGSGIDFHIAFQSEDQPVERWGEEAAAIIMQNAGLMLYFGGNMNIERLERVSKLLGEVTSMESKVVEENGQTIHKREPVKHRVVSPERIRSLKSGEVIVVARDLQGVVIGKTRPFHKRSDYRAMVKDRTRPAKRSRRALAGRRILRMLTRKPHHDEVLVPGQRDEFTDDDNAMWDEFTDDDISMWNVSASDDDKEGTR